MKTCIKCNVEKEIILFVKNICKDCKKIQKQKYYNENKEHIKEKQRKWNSKNKENISKRNKEYHSANLDTIRSQQNESYRNNKRKKKDSINKSVKKRRVNDPIFKLKTNISRNINRYIKLLGGSKSNNKTIDFVPWTLEELKKHIEALFEPWMNWHNQGTYKVSEWDDANPETWKWQLDHIIPQSKLLYDSMTHENFEKCWSLSNLRPYSAKQNLIDGNRR